MSKKAKKQKKPLRPWLWAAAAAVTVIAVIIIVLVAGGAGDNTPTEPTVPPVKIEDVDGVAISLGNGLQITDIGSYTGLYMEDGKDEVVSRVLMIVVKNTGTQTVQYAEIQLTDGNATANFSLSTLPPGESLVALEKTQMSYDDGKSLTQASARNVAMFSAEPTLCEDKLKIQTLNGALNVTNISGEDITGDVIIYYKNSASDMLYGGITYRVTISGGIKAGEIKQVTAGHFTTSGSRVMFVTCG